MKNKDNGISKKLAVGILIGIAGITPGLSAGVLAAAFGLYEPILESIARLKKEFKKSLIFLVPIILGTAVGMLGFGNIMKYLMTSFETTVTFAFLGLIAGSFPSLVKEANEGIDKIKKSYIVTAIISFLLITILNLSMKTIIPQGLTLNWYNSVISGGVIAFGTVIPGVSSSFMLIQLGVYKELLNALTTFQYDIIIFLSIGFAITSMVFISIANFMFKKYRAYSYYSVIGFLLGSVVGVFPKLHSGYLLVLDVFVFLFCTLGLLILIKKVTNRKTS
ncbi:MAG: DUF368 domain-containing protein [Clostridiales bacterium]|nr:DUF368 domain-containing protein [Clostridiales bacterium]